MGKAVVGVFTYIGIGCGIFLSVAIGLFLVGDAFQKISRFKK